MIKLTIFVLYSGVEIISINISDISDTVRETLKKYGFIHSWYDFIQHMYKIIPYLNSKYV